jgi:hypothetical protein
LAPRSTTEIAGAVTEAAVGAGVLAWVIGRLLSG